jgi:NADH dehydrogenase/NADH:ubiquinone oxidoreductase subunit G
MSDTVKLTIDGVELRAPDGTNLIEAAELAGVHIPNLCYMKGMKGIGACRLCLVEVEGARAPVIACNTKAKDGMVVNTRTEKILEQRKFVIDLILSMHPLDCMTCTKAGVCRLQSYAYEFGIQQSTYTLKKFGHAVDEANPFIKISPDYCILCGRCVRVCKEQDTNVLDFMGRGVGSKVSTAVDKGLHASGCTFCGSCLDACPVNAILEADRWRKGREWEYEEKNSACLLCGDGCEIAVSTREGLITKINSAPKEDSTTQYICAYGRYGYDYVESESRGTAPMVRKNGKLLETTWEEALGAAAKGLKKAGKDAGFISTANLSNEDALALRDFAYNVVKTKNLASTLSLYADRESLVNSDSASITGADLIVTVGIDPSQGRRTLPALDASIRRKVARGAKLITINSAETGLDNMASAKFLGDEVSGIKSLIKAALDKGAKAEKELEAEVRAAGGSEEASAAGELLAVAKSPIVLTSPALFGAASNISLLKGPKTSVISVTYESNARGAALMGLADAEGKSYAEMLDTGPKALYLVGPVPISERPKTDFLVVEDTHLSGVAKDADVFLPAATYFESSGTIVDYKGALKSFHAIIEPVGESKSHGDIFIDLSKLMGKAVKKPKTSEVKAALKGKPERVLREFMKKEALDINAEHLIGSLNESVLSSRRLLWLREAEKAEKT